MSSCLINIESSILSMSSKLMYICLLKLITCANRFEDAIDFNDKIVDVVLIINSRFAFIINWFGIIGYTFDNIILLDRLISFRTAILWSFINILLWFFTNSLAKFWLSKTNQLRAI